MELSKYIQNINDNLPSSFFDGVDREIVKALIEFDGFVKYVYLLKDIELGRQQLEPIFERLQLLKRAWCTRKYIDKVEWSTWSVHGQEWIDLFIEEHLEDADRQQLMPIAIQHLQRVESIPKTVKTLFFQYARELYKIAVDIGENDLNVLKCYFAKFGNIKSFLIDERKVFICYSFAESAAIAIQNPGSYTAARINRNWDTPEMTAIREKLQDMALLENNYMFIGKISTWKSTIETQFATIITAKVQHGEHSFVKMSRELGEADMQVIDNVAYCMLICMPIEIGKILNTISNI